MKIEGIEPTNSEACLVLFRKTMAGLPLTTVIWNLKEDQSKEKQYGDKEALFTSRITANSFQRVGDGGEWKGVPGRFMPA